MELFQHFLTVKRDAFVFLKDANSDGSIENPINLDDPPIELVFNESKEETIMEKTNKESHVKKPPAKGKCKDNANYKNNKEKDNKDSKTDEEAEGKKPPIYIVERWSTSLVQTVEANKRKDDWIELKEKKRKLGETAPKKSCGAGNLCWLQGVDIKLQGKKQNATKCETCMWVCHNVCLFLWDKKVYCICCYKMVVTKEYDTSITFNEIFEEQWQWKRHHLGEPTPVIEQLQEYIDEYLKTSGFSMTSKEFYEWKEM